MAMWFVLTRPVRVAATIAVFPSMRRHEPPRVTKPRRRVARAARQWFLSLVLAVAAVAPYCGSARAGETAGLAPVDDMIGALAKRLEANPDNPEGWRMLGWSYFHTGHYAESVKAYAKAVELQPQSAGFQAMYGEAMTRAAKDIVTPEAKAAFEVALKLDPAEPRARYFMGLAKLQEGDKRGALQSWTALLREAGAGGEWAPDLRTRVAALAAEIGISLDPALLKAEAAPPVPPATVQGPTAADVKAAESMPEQDRNAAIRRMVDGLTARLARSPKDADGWIMLIRSRSVLGDKDAAKDALRNALLVFAGEDAEKSRIVAAARELGVAQ